MKQDLSFGWAFAPITADSDVNHELKRGQLVDIPHCAYSSPYSYSNNVDGERLFAYNIYFDDDYPSFKTKILHFGGVMLKFRLYFNNHDYGSYVSGYLPVDIDVSADMRKRDNRVLVIVDGRPDPLVPPFGNVVDYQLFSGIYREVYVSAHPENYIEDLFIKTNDKGHIEIKTLLANPEEGYIVKHAIYKGDTEIGSWIGENYDVPCPRLWSIEDPFLYKVVTTYGEDIRIDMVGFRSVDWRKDGFYLNGSKVKLKGFNRHQTYPYFGPAAPAALQQDDASIIKKELGANVVRTSHYPQSEKFLSYCDEIGLLVLDEIPGWQFISEKKVWRETLVDFARRMILKERNHPCVIAYGLRVDESKDDDELYSQIQAVKNELDPDRKSIGVRNFMNSHLLEDVYAYNDFSCNSLKGGLLPTALYGVKGKPKIVTENMGHMFPTKAFDRVERRVEHALRHGKVLNDANKRKNLSGMITWCAFDYYTHPDFGSGDMICHHGVYSMNRTPKFAAYLYMSQVKTNFFEVIPYFNPGDQDASVPQPSVVFTDADYVELYRGENKVGRFLPDKKNYPNLEHAPIFIDDNFGLSFDEPCFTEKERRAIAPDLSRAIFWHYDLKEEKGQKVLNILKDRGVTKEDFEILKEKYRKAWGGPYGRMTVVAYKGEIEIGRKVFDAPLSCHYEYTITKSTLENDETYDACRLTIRKVDCNGNLCLYGRDSLSILCSGPIRNMGDSLISLEGGMASVYIASQKVDFETPARIKVISNSGEDNIDILVK